MTRKFVPMDDSYGGPATANISRGVRSGKRLFVCGHRGLNSTAGAQSQDDATGDVASQIREAMDLLLDSIEQASMRPAHTVQLHVYYRGNADEAAYRSELLSAFPQFSQALLVLTPVGGQSHTHTSVEIDAIVIEDDYSAIVEDEAGRVVGSRRGEWLCVQAHSTARVLEAQIAEVAARTHRVLHGLRADIDDVCRVNAYYSASLDTAGVERAEKQLAAVFAGTATSYRGTVLPAALTDDQCLRVELVALRGTDGARLDKRGATAPGWGWPQQLPYPQALRSGDCVFVSSQLPLNGDGELCHNGDLPAQTHLIMNHMQAALRAVGADVQHMAKVNVYVDGQRDAADLIANADIRSEYHAAPGPASTGVEVDRLGVDGALIAADCVAVVD